MCKIDSSWEAAVENRKLSSALCDDLEGWDQGARRQFNREGIICIHIYTFCCTAESNTISLSNYIPPQKTPKMKTAKIATTTPPPKSGPVSAVKVVGQNIFADSRQRKELAQGRKMLGRERRKRRFWWRPLDFENWRLYSHVSLTSGHTHSGASWVSIECESSSLLCIFPMKISLQDIRVAEMIA